MTARLRAYEPPGIQRHVPLPAAEQWRCAWRDQGLGTVVALIELCGQVTGYDVALDSAPGHARRAWPGDVRRLQNPVHAAWRAAGRTSGNAAALAALAIPPAPNAFCVLAANP